MYITFIILIIYIVIIFKFWMKKCNKFNHAEFISKEIHRHKNSNNYTLWTIYAGN